MGPGYKAAVVTRVEVTALRLGGGNADVEKKRDLSVF
jgi:hypothetical protein